jgi:hypothetical protein
VTSRTSPGREVPEPGWSRDDRVTALRPDAELAGVDVPAAISRGIAARGPLRTALFTDAAIAAAIEAGAMGIGPHPVGFLARFVRAGGIARALRLPEPLIGAEPTALARRWLEAALAAGTGVAQDQVFARWLEMVATLLAVRRDALGSRPGGPVKDALRTDAGGQASMPRGVASPAGGGASDGEGLARRA